MVGFGNGKPLKRLDFLALRFVNKKLFSPFLYVGAFLVIVFIISGLAMYFAATPQYCSICHSMRPDITAWRHSTHANVTCYSCHVHRGPVIRLYGGAISLKVIDLKEIEEIYSEISGRYKKPINGDSRLSEEIDSEVCEKCHAMENRRVTPAPGMIIDHKKHKAKGIKCTVCHNRAAHERVKGHPESYPSRMKMRYCMKCHTGGRGKLQASSDCRICHTEDFQLKPKSHLVAGFVEFTDPLNPKTRAVHGIQAKSDKEYCLSCHKEKFCTDCHGVEMPHPAKDWTRGKKEHAAIGSKKPESCKKCHVQTNFCSACHHPQWKPELGPWYGAIPGPSQHARIANVTDGKACLKSCHTTLFCDHCHVTGEKLTE